MPISCSLADNVPLQSFVVGSLRCGPLRYLGIPPLASVGVVDAVMIMSLVEIVKVRLSCFYSFNQLSFNPMDYAVCSVRQQ